MLKYLFFILFTLSSYSIIEGSIDEVYNTASYQVVSSKYVLSNGKYTYGNVLKEQSRASSFAISPNVLMTAAHAVEKFKTNGFNHLEIRSILGVSKKFRLSEFEIIIPSEYIENIEEQKSKPRCERTYKCDYDFALIKFKEAIFGDFYPLADKFSVAESLEITGFGVHIYRFYKFTLPALLTCKPKRFMSSKSDEHFRVGANTIHEVLKSDSLNAESAFIDIKASKSTPIEGSYAGSGDSGGAVMQKKEVIGIMCKLFDYSPKSDDVYNRINLITNSKVKSFINQNL